MSKTLIIAEAGVNHNGDIKLAKKLIAEAAAAGADAIKFQTFVGERVISKHAPKADYQKVTTDKSESQLEMLKRLELSESNHKELIDYCNKNKIIFLSTPHDIESIYFLDELGLDTIKIPSGEIINVPYLRTVGRLQKKIILSTGMANLNEIENALNILINSGTKENNIVLLHCNTEYPTPIEDANLLAIKTLQNKFNVSIGYSDHTIGNETSIAAVALGACVIEKHFTLDRTMTGPDHAASSEPSEFKDLVYRIRNIEKALGTGEKQPSKSEQKNLEIVRKSIVAKTYIRQGDILSEDNITVKRPGFGISPIYWDKVIGSVAKKDFNPDDFIEQ